MGVDKKDTDRLLHADDVSGTLTGSHSASQSGKQGVGPRHIARLRGAGIRERTTLHLPSVILVKLRREALRQGRNLSWVLEDILRELMRAGKIHDDPAFDGSQPKTRNVAPDTARDPATILIDSALLASLSRMAGRRSLSYAVSDLLTAYFRDRALASLDGGREKGDAIRHE